MSEGRPIANWWVWTNKCLYGAIWLIEGIKEPSTTDATKETITLTVLKQFAENLKELAISVRR